MGATDKIKNAGQAAKGDAKQVAGRMSGDRDLQASGQADKTAGSLKQAGEKVKDAFK